MKKRQFIAGFAAAAIAAGMMALPASATVQGAGSGTSYTGITFETNPTFTKTLVTETGAVPDVSFAYTVTQADAQAGTATTLPIYRTENVPTIAAVDYDPGDSNVKTATVDFTGVTFTEPGVYRYFIHETATNTTTYPYITDDPVPYRTLDVYVEDNESGVLEIMGSVLYSGQHTTAPAKSDEERTEGTKSEGYVNTYGHL